MIKFELKHPKADQDMLGIIPEFLSEQDPRPAAAQIAENYIGGWSNSAGSRRIQLTDRGMEYPGDPPRPLIAEAKLRDEVIKFYAGAWIAIVQPDGSFEIDRID